MTDTEIKALIERLRQRSHSNHMLLTDPPRRAPDADCHAAADMLVLHLATKQELSDYKQKVSDAVGEYEKDQPHIWKQSASGYLSRFIIPKPKPDPLVEIIGELDDGTWGETKAEYADRFRAALKARGLEIREKNDD